MHVYCTGGVVCSSFFIDRVKMTPLNKILFLAMAGLCICSIRASDIHKFTVGLYKEIAKSSPSDGNIAVSPFSVSSALTLTYIGAAGQTKTEVATALGISQDVTAKSLGQKYQLVNAASDKYTLKSANAVYVDKSRPILPAYSRTVAEDFKAKVSSVDFGANTDGVRREINAFVEQNTNSKIKDLIPDGSLSAQTVFILVNAVYFKADWKTQFQVADTKKEQFNLPNGATKLIDLMHVEDRFGYTESAALGQAQVLEMAYKGDETSMVVILPRQGTSLQSVENALTPEVLEAVLGELGSSRVSVYLPKFKQTSTYELTDALKAMGIKKASGGGADFSGITLVPVFVSRVQHKVFVEVDEKGTEAAAATAVFGNFLSPAMPLPIPEFRADRPFLFLIRYNPSSTTLFMGRISNPSV